jgi:hypothetical protein
MGGIFPNLCKTKGSLKPDFKTIADFRRDNRTALPPAAANAVSSSPLFVLSHILAQCGVYAGLVALAFVGVRFEPSDKIGIKAQGQLLFDGAEKKAAPRRAPIPVRGGAIVGHGAAA